MKIVVVSDSFKGCLDSRRAGEAIASGCHRAWPGCDTIVLSAADGGEGTAEALGTGMKLMASKVCGPLGDIVEAAWRYDPERGVAVVDMAAAAGLPLVTPGERNPLHTTTFGVGQLIKSAKEAGAGAVILGLGGSATNDAGLGMIQALGGVVKDKKGSLLREPFTGSMLGDVGSIELKRIDPEVRKMRCILACDVTSPFTGCCGSARVFAPQKGADSATVEILEKGMRNVARVIKNQTGLDLNKIAGSGAAGGCGGTLHALLDAEIRRGCELILDFLQFDAMIESADLVITGEGSADYQTLLGKLPSSVMLRSRGKGVPVVLMAGKVADEEKLERGGFDLVVDINSEEMVAGGDTRDSDALKPEVAEKRLAHAAAELRPRLAKNVKAGV